MILSRISLSVTLKNVDPFSKKVPVAVNHENDTCFGNGLVMGYEDCKYLADLGETSKVVSIINLGICHIYCKQVPDLSRLSKSDLIMWASFGSLYAIKV